MRTLMFICVFGGALGCTAASEVDAESAKARVDCEEKSGELVGDSADVVQKFFIDLMGADLASRIAAAKATPRPSTITDEQFSSSAFLSGSEIGDVFLAASDAFCSVVQGQCVRTGFTQGSGSNTHSYDELGRWKETSTTARFEGASVQDALEFSRTYLEVRANSSATYMPKTFSISSTTTSAEFSLTTRYYPDAKSVDAIRSETSVFRGSTSRICQWNNDARKLAGCEDVTTIEEDGKKVASWEQNGSFRWTDDGRIAFSELSSTGRSWDGSLVTTDLQMTAQPNRAATQPDRERWSVQSKYCGGQHIAFTTTVPPEVLGAR